MAKHAFLSASASHRWLNVMFLNDEHISEDYQDIINDLLNYRKCLCIVRGAIIVKDIAEEDDISLTGIDAARLYCHMNRITTRIVDEIDIVDIVKNCDETEVLIDILQLINEVCKVNEDLEMAMCSDATEDMVRTQKRKLQYFVEHLAFNCQCIKPFTDEHGRQLSSLSCIDYEL